MKYDDNLIGQNCQNPQCEKEITEDDAPVRAEGKFPDFVGKIYCSAECASDNGDYR